MISKERPQLKVSKCCARSASACSQLLKRSDSTTAFQFSVQSGYRLDNFPTLWRGPIPNSDDDTAPLHRRGCWVEVWIDFSHAPHIGSLRAGITPASGAKATPSYLSFPAWTTIRALQAGRINAAPKNVTPPRGCSPVGGGKSGWSGDHLGNSYRS